MTQNTIEDMRVAESILGAITPWSRSAVLAHILSDKEAKNAFKIRRELQEFMYPDQGATVPNYKSIDGAFYHHLGEEGRYATGFVTHIRGANQTAYLLTERGQMLGKPLAAHALRADAEMDLDLSKALGRTRQYNLRPRILVDTLELLHALAEGPTEIDHNSYYLPVARRLHAMGILESEQSTKVKSTIRLKERGRKLAEFTEPIRSTIIDLMPTAELVQSLRRYENNPDLARAETTKVSALYNQTAPTGKSLFLDKE